MFDAAAVFMFSESVEQREKLSRALVIPGPTFIVKLRDGAFFPTDPLNVVVAVVGPVVGSGETDGVGLGIAVGTGVGEGETAGVGDGADPDVPSCWSARYALIRP